MSRNIAGIVLFSMALTVSGQAAAKEKFIVQPVQVGAETVRYEQGVATVELLNRQGSVQIQPLPVDHDRLMLTASVDQKGAILTESGRRQLVRKICETNGPLLGAGATVHLDLFEKGQAKGPAFGSVTATRRDCMI